MKIFIVSLHVIVFCNVSVEDNIKTDVKQIEWEGVRRVRDW